MAARAGRDLEGAGEGEGAPHAPVPRERAPVRATKRIPCVHCRQPHLPT